MTICILIIYIVIVVFPVFGTGIVWRIDIDTVHLFCIEIFQKLQRMVIVRLNQCMAKAAVRSILHSVNRSQCRINRLTKFCYCNDLIQLECYLLVRLSAVTEHIIAVYLHNGINIADVAGLQRNF